MARTLYELHNASFSDEAHMQARTKLYPKVFNVPQECLSFDDDTLVGESGRGNILDGEMGVDRIVRVKIKKLTGKLSFTVQERFRRPQYAKYKDITITEWNHASGLKSELYKINAGIFLYGYYDISIGEFVDAIAISVTDLLLKIARQDICFDYRWNKKQQTFICLKFDDLHNSNVVLYRDALSN